MKRFRFSAELTHIALLGIFLLTAARISPDPDTWWHLNAGKWMVEHSELLRLDQFSYTRLGQPWPAPGWPVQIMLYLVYQAGGIGGLNLLTGAVFALTFYFANKALSGNEMVKSLTLVLGAAVSSLHASARPALFTLIFVAIYLWVLEDYRWQRAKHLWLLPVLMVLWINSHGLAVIGFGLVGLYALGMTKVEIAEKRLILKVVPCPLYLLIPLLLIAACLNPYGPTLLIYPLQAASVHWKAAQQIQEWQSPDFHRLFVQPFIWLLLLTFALVGGQPQTPGADRFPAGGILRLPGSVFGAQCGLVRAGRANCFDPRRRAAGRSLGQALPETLRFAATALPKNPGVCVSGRACLAGDDACGRNPPQ